MLLNQVDVVSVLKVVHLVDKAIGRLAFLVQLVKYHELVLNEVLDFWVGLL